MHIIGITGPSGAGKSMLCGVLQKNNIHTIDADEVYHSLLVPPSPCLDALTEAFGKDILATDGSLDRKALSKIVFNDKEKLDLLNSTVLGFVLNKIRSEISALDKSGATAVAVDAPTLIESGFHKECDTVVAVLSSRDTRIERIIARDDIDKDAAELRTHAQRPDEFYIKRADFIIKNNNGKDELEAKAAELLRALGL